MHQGGRRKTRTRPKLRPGLQWGDLADKFMKCFGVPAVIIVGVNGTTVIVADVTTGLWCGPWATWTRIGYVAWAAVLCGLLLCVVSEYIHNLGFPMTAQRETVFAIAFAVRRYVNRVNRVRMGLVFSVLLGMKYFGTGHMVLLEVCSIMVNVLHTIMVLVVAAKVYLCTRPLLRTEKICVSKKK